MACSFSAASGASLVRSGWNVQCMTTSFRLATSTRCPSVAPRGISFSSSFSTSSQRAFGENSQPSKPPYNILFCGNDAFSVAVLDAVWRRKDLWKSLIVLTTKYDRPTWALQMESVKKGGDPLPIGNPVEVFAKEKGLPLVLWHKRRSLGIDQWDVPKPFQEVSNDNVLLTASFGRMIPQSMLQRFQLPTTSLALNVHPSLLPQLRGAAPIQTAIARRMRDTGITVQQLSDGKFDQGNILAQTPFTLPERTTYDEILGPIAAASGELTVETLANLPERLRNASPQDSSRVTWALKATPRKLAIEWNTMTAEDIEAQMRGFGHITGPVTWLAPNNKEGKAPQPFLQVEFKEVTVPHSNWADEYPGAADLLRDAQPGTAVWQRKMDMLIVKTASTSDTQSDQPHVLFVNRLLTLSKSALTAPDWWRGYGERQDARKRIRFSNAPIWEHETLHQEAVAAYKQARKEQAMAKGARVGKGGD